MEIDFSALTKVQVANNHRRQDFHLKWNRSAEKFTISNEKWDEMQLTNNSLTQYTAPDGTVYLAVDPGNDGTFLKKREGRNKGKTFKNSQLHVSLEQAGYEGTKFELVLAGHHNEAPYYKVAGDRVMQSPADELPLEAEEVAVDANVEPQNDTF